MTEQERQETIDRWAKFIIPAVFKAEDEVLKKNPEWRERLKGIIDEDRREVAEAYCQAIAEEIVSCSCEEGGDR